MNTRTELAIETAPIRLTTEESRIILKVSMAGKPVDGGHYQYAALADLGILRRIEVPEEKDTKLKIDQCWKEATTALRQKNGERLHQAMHDLERITRDRDRNETKVLFELTDLGKQIARGITVRLQPNGKSNGK